MISLKKVSARGKRYAYIRGTDIAVVRGFVGTEEQFDSAVARAVSSLGSPLKSAFDGFRLDAARALHKGASSRAREMGRAYSLSSETIRGMLLDVGDECQITGLPFDYHANGDPNVRVRPMAPSLDRIDNKRGYEIGNVRLVCACVNIALNEWGLENFENICLAFLGNLENVRAQNGKRSLVGSAKPLETDVIMPQNGSTGGR